MACGACGSRTAKKTYVYTAPDGSTSVYASEVEARAKVARNGGSYKAQ